VATKEIHEIFSKWGRAARPSAGARPHFDETGMNGRAVTKVVPYMMAVRLRKSGQKEMHEKLLSGQWSHL